MTNYERTDSARFIINGATDPTLYIMPASAPTSGQALIAATPSGGQSQLSWGAGGGGGGGVAGADTQVQFNQGDAFGASSAFTFDYTGMVLNLNGSMTFGGDSNANISRLSNAVVQISNSLSVGNLGVGVVTSDASGILASTATLPILRGGTGQSSAPSLGEFLIGDAGGAYALGSINVTSPVTVSFDVVSGEPHIGVHATASATPSYLVQRDSSGDFSANNITANDISLTTGSISTAPANANDIVNKQYADSLAAGLAPKEPVRVGTTTALAAVTYANGTDGVGATLTANANGALTVDSVAVDPGDRVLVKNQVSQLQNGIYNVTDPGDAGTPFVLTRSTDFDQTSNMVAGSYTFITEGTLNASEGWILHSTTPITVGTDAITFIQFSGAGLINAGTGLSKSGNTLSIANTAVTAGSYAFANVTVNAQGQLTAASAGAPVTSVALMAPGEFSVSGSPVTTTGTLAFDWASAVTLAHGGTGSDLSAAAQGAVPYFNSTAAMSALAPGTAGQILGTQGAAANPHWVNVSSLLTAGTGISLSGTTNVTISSTGVTSVAATVPAYMAVSGSPITTTGTLAFSFNNQSGNKVFASPANGSSGAMSMRALTSADLPAGTGSVTSVGLALPDIFTVSGSPVTTSGTLTGDLATQARNIVFAGPASGADATPTFRGLVAADINAIAPTWTAQHVFDYAPATGVTHNWSVRFDKAPFGQASGAVLEMGIATAFDGSTSGFFAGSASGTYVGINAAGSYAGNFLDLQLAGVSQFSVSSAGLVYGQNVTVASMSSAGVVFNDASGVLSGGNQVDLTANVSGILPTANGGTGAANTTPAQGTVLYANSSNVYVPLAVGTSNQVLTTKGAGANPQYQSIASLLTAGTGISVTGTTNATIALSTPVATVNGGTGADLSGGAQGAVIYQASSTALAGLTAGTSGQLLMTQGASANPTWQSIASSLTAGTGISITGTTNATIALSTPVSLTNGGTGADLHTATQGSVPYINASTAMSALAPGTANQVMVTGGASANPSFVNIASLLTAGTGLSKSGTTNATIALADTAVTPAAYTYASITVDQQGRITAASSGTAPVTTISAGSGIGVSGSTTVTVRQKRAYNLVFMSGFTPSATGADANVLEVPYSPTDGTTSLTYNVRTLRWRTETTSASGTASAIRVEKYTGSGSFSATNMMTGGDLSMANAAYDANTQTFSTATLASGDKVRLNVTTLNAQNTGAWMVALLIEEQ